MAFCWREDQKLVNHGSRSSVLKYWMLRLGMGWDDGGKLWILRGVVWMGRLTVEILAV